VLEWLHASGILAMPILPSGGANSSILQKNYT
jgi:hypothetical protein